MKTLYALVRDRLEGEDDKDILWDDEITRRLLEDVLYKDRDFVLIDESHNLRHLFENDRVRRRYADGDTAGFEAHCFLGVAESQAGHFRLVDLRN